MSKTKERIHDSNLRYKQGLGQNFIYDEDLLAALVASSEITKDDDVLEIGPGAGSMTKHLCDAAHHVLSIELDERLIPLLTAFSRSQRLCGVRLTSTTCRVSVMSTRWTVRVPTSLRPYSR